MKRAIIFLLPAALVIPGACTEDRVKPGKSSGLENIVMITNINTGATSVGYLGTRKDLSAGSYNNAKAQQVVSYALAQVHGEDVFLIEARGGDKVKKFTRGMDGTLKETGSLTMPASSFAYCMAFESNTRAYLTLGNTGKIAIINPEAMTLTGYIDLTAYALGDASPDPGGMLYRDGKLYVACIQTSDGITSNHPAQLLIIDLANNNKITSITDTRTTYASNPSSAGSMFFTENGDLYMLCMGSWGYVPGQKSGFLRVKNGQNVFDPGYFFNVTDYAIVAIPGGHLDYLHRIQYAGNNIVYATGNIPALASNPPDYVKDKTYGAFKVDVVNQVIIKIDIPFSNGYAACVMPYDNKVYYGMSTNTGVGIYSYDPVNNVVGTKPVVNTQGDPSILYSFGL